MVVVSGRAYFLIHTHLVNHCAMFLLVLTFQSHSFGHCPNILTVGEGMQKKLDLHEPIQWSHYCRCHNSLPHGPLVCHQGREKLKLLGHQVVPTQSNLEFCQRNLATNFGGADGKSDCFKPPQCELEVELLRVLSSSGISTLRSSLPYPWHR